MMLTRLEFANHFNQIKPGLGKPTGSLWIPEDYLAKNRRYWFVCVPPLKISRQGRSLEYYTWCKDNLSSSPLCYSTNDFDNTEWWGFKNRNDIMFWMLKWV